MDGLLQIRNVSGTVIFGDDDTGSDGDSIKKTDHKKDQITGRADSGKCRASKKISNDQRVGGVI